MLEFENFMLSSFPKVFKTHFLKTEESLPCPIEKARKKAIFFLESQCTVKYGYFAEAHDNVDMSLSNSFYKIPTSFDSAFILPYILNEDIDPLVIQNIISVLKRSRRSSGFWNFFFDPDHKSYSLIPDDVDDTALAALVLLQTKNLTFDECRHLAHKIGIHRLIEPKSSAITTWIPDHHRNIIFSRYQQVPKLCVGVLTNLLWFLATIGMETEPEFIDSLNYVAKFVDQLIEHSCNDEIELPGMCYYTNKHIHFFFVARFLERSEYAQGKFGRKFVELLVVEFKHFWEKIEEKEALDIAFMVLAIWHLGLHKFGEENRWLGNEREIGEIRDIMKGLCDRLLELQDKKDGSFRAWVTYRWNNMGHWGGTKAMTTGFVLAVLGICQREIYGSDGNSTKNYLEEKTLLNEQVFGGKELKCWGKTGFGDSGDGQSSSDESR